MLSEMSRALLHGFPCIDFADERHRTQRSAVLNIYAAFE